MRNIFIDFKPSTIRSAMGWQFSVSCCFIFVLSRSSHRQRCTVGARVIFLSLSHSRILIVNCGGAISIERWRTEYFHSNPRVVYWMLNLWEFKWFVRWIQPIRPFSPHPSEHKYWPLSCYEPIVFFSLQILLVYWNDIESIDVRVAASHRSNKIFICFNQNKIYELQWAARFPSTTNRQWMSKRDCWR